MFSTFLKTNFSFWVTITLSSANAYSLDQWKILSFGKELKGRKQCGLKEKILVISILSFSLNAFSAFPKCKI